jgi:hypothetical protein
VDSSNLTPEQLLKVRASIGRQLRYLNRLLERMTRRGFPGNDPLYQAALRAQAEVQGLYVALHYASCPPGTVGRRSESGDSPDGTPTASLLGFRPMS